MMKILNLKGNIVPIPGMYNLDLTLNLDFYRKFIEKKISDGDRIFYLAKSASEFKYLSQNERLMISKILAKYAETEDILILSQPLGSGSLDSQIEEAKQMSDYGASALVVLPTTPVMSGKFFSSHYEKAGFSENTHGPYYVEYLEKFSSSVSKPIIFHDAPLSNGLGLPIKYLDQIMTIDQVKGIKVHSPDPSSMHSIYEKYSDSNLCFDGFGKTLQFWSFQWGASARHSCWSWFDSKSDQKFFHSLMNLEYNSAIEIIRREWNLANEIKKTGFAGYKELMRIDGLIDNNLTRIPGLSVSNDEAKKLSIAYSDYKKTL